MITSSRIGPQDAVPRKDDKVVIARSPDELPRQDMPAWQPAHRWHKVRLQPGAFRENFNDVSPCGARAVASSERLAGHGVFVGYFEALTQQQLAAAHALARDIGTPELRESVQFSEGAAVDCVDTFVVTVRRRLFRLVFAPLCTAEARRKQAKSLLLACHPDKNPSLYARSATSDARNADIDRAMDCFHLVRHVHALLGTSRAYDVLDDERGNIHAYEPLFCGRWAAKRCGTASTEPDRRKGESMPWVLGAGAVAAAAAARSSARPVLTGSLTAVVASSACATVAAFKEQLMWPVRFTEKECAFIEACASTEWAMLAQGPRLMLEDWQDMLEKLRSRALHSPTLYEDYMALQVEIIRRANVAFSPWLSSLQDAYRREQCSRGSVINQLIDKATYPMQGAVADQFYDFQSAVLAEAQT